MYSKMYFKVKLLFWHYCKVHFLKAYLSVNKHVRAIKEVMKVNSYYFIITILSDSSLNLKYTTSAHSVELNTLLTNVVNCLQ